MCYAVGTDEQVACVDAVYHIVYLVELGGCYVYCFHSIVGFRGLSV